MKILLVNRYYGGEQTPTGRMLHDLSLFLAKQGHDVTVLSTKVVYLGSKASPVERHVNLRTVTLYALGFGRVLDWLLFWFQTAVALVWKKWDSCILMTDPPFLPLAAVPAALIHSDRRFYWWTMDLYPEALVAAHLIRPNEFSDNILRWFNEIGLRKMSGVIALGEKQKERLQCYKAWKGDVGFSIVVPPWDLRPLVTNKSAAESLRARYGWSSKKVALYAGNLGEGHLFREIVHAAGLLHDQQRSDWLFVFACRGKGVSELKKIAHDLPNIFVTDYLPPQDAAGLLSAADVHVVTMKQGWEGVIVPSKLYGILSTNAPVLFVGPRDSDTALAIHSMSRGICLKPGCSANDFVSSLDSLKEMTLEHISCGDGPASICEFIVS
jgi:colanic acid biosynthesis glycosyl transferase WcaI